MKRLRLHKFIDQWHKLHFRTKILAVGALVSVLLMGCIGFVAIHQFSQTKDESEIPEGPYANFGLNITNEEVYVDMTVRFTVHCYFHSYGGYPIPEGDLFQIIQVFVCLEDDLLEFNDSLGDIQSIENISVLFGDVCLSADEEVRLEFQSRFPLQAETPVYIGVFALHTTSLTRWDRYTTVLAP